MASKNSKSYKHHTMYDPKTGKSQKTTSYSNHLSLKSKGWTHSKPAKSNPLKKRVVDNYKKKKSSTKPSGYGY